MLLMQASSECIYLWGGNIHFWCIFLPNFVPLLTPIALVCWVMSVSWQMKCDMWECDFWRWSPQSSVMISRRQLFDFACGHSGVTKVKDDDVVMFIEACLQVEASEADRGRYRRCSLPFSSKLRRKSDGSCSILATFYSDIARAERKISCAGAVRNRAAHFQVRPESGFTKFRFQAMTQYPEKSDQWLAR